MAQIHLENGKTYELPESFTLGEMRIVERYAGGHLNEGGYGLAQMCGAIHVAIARSEPQLSFEEIQAAVDQIDVGSLEAMLDVDGQSPPALSNGDSPASLSAVSDPASEPSPENATPPASGARHSVTGFRSDRATSTS